MSENGKEDIIERLVQTLEVMMTTRDKMYEENTYANYRQVWKLREEAYTPAREELKVLLSELIKNKVDADKAI